MARLFYAFALLAVAVSAAVILTTSADLPMRVASHFNAAGDGSGFMSLDEYRRLMLALAVAMPLGIVAALGLLPRVAPGLVNVPNARAWLSPPYRDETLATLGMRGALCAILITAFICAVHLLIVRANAQAPVHLDATALGVVVGAFVLAIAAWVIALILRFRKPPR